MRALGASPGLLEFLDGILSSPCDPTLGYHLIQFEFLFPGVVRIRGNE